VRKSYTKPSLRILGQLPQDDQLLMFQKVCDDISRRTKTVAVRAEPPQRNALRTNVEHVHDHHLTAVRSDLG
jgi:hypothetical protein